MEEERDLQNALKRLTDEIQILKEQAARRGLAFTSPTTEQLEKKVRSRNTPFIYGIGWTSTGPVTGNFICQVFVNNPDSYDYYYLYVYFFFGPANIIPDVSTALLSIDQRLYRGFAQIPYLSSGSTDSVQFNYNFPSGIPLGFYMSNVFLFKEEHFGVSPFLDRGGVEVEVT
jgi:hypothetical protein